ncbi:aminopeptidase [Pullulanibacillus pueri]|uniref:Aminopeptidase n=1 Tax=Pullulanibacillus pueri TaxID=1437324 RepID=A0A8J3EK38_9BACL|nr:aminopeptidase [Pullulanibacillus pueri]MBM7679992.1 aminopeptidase [Pullulanibacillus pueri]GGH73830.1 aminopeptidase [Pullulanibacillus pueri]
MENFHENLEKYAELAVKVGINIQKGQELVINAPIHAISFVRIVTKKAYQAGAKHVHFRWSDDALTLTRFTYAPEEAFKEYPEWEAKGLETLAQRGAAFLDLRTPNLDLLNGIDPERVAMDNKTTSSALENYREYRMADKVAWSILAVPSEEWAQKLFPNLETEKAVEKLWETLFKMTRADQEDPIQAWKNHQQTLDEKLNYLNEKKYQKLHYTAPGTDLTIEFPKAYQWAGGAANNAAGTSFFPNIPTEEVFTLPLKTGVNGTVTSTKPLNYSGTLIEKLSLTFENGRIIDFNAESGYESLKRLIETDEGSHYLGEVALVPHNSPISESGLIFFNTLYDENASCHLAIGKAYPKCLENGVNMTREELDAHGANKSLTHVDFMIGSAELNIDGITASGTEEPVFRNGLWAF